MKSILDLKFRGLAHLLLSPAGNSSVSACTTSEVVQAATELFESQKMISCSLKALPERQESLPKDLTGPTMHLGLVSMSTDRMS